MMKFNEMRERVGIELPPTVKEICSQYTGMSTNSGYSLQEIIHQSLPHIFDFNFPMSAEWNRENLEAKIIKKYYFRRIACSDIEEWKLRLDTKLNELMPYYNQMFDSMKYLTDILDDVDYTKLFDEITRGDGSEKTTSTQNVENTSSASSNQSGKTSVNKDGENINRMSDTPQGSLVGLLNDTYMSAAARTTDEQTETTDSEGRTVSSGAGSSDTHGTFDIDREHSGSRDYTERVKGKMYPGSKSKLVMEYRKAILNLDADIVNRLSDLFMFYYTPYVED